MSPAASVAAMTVSMRAASDSIGRAGTLVGFDPQRRRGRPPAGTALGFEPRRRLTGSGGGAVHVAGEQRGAGDQHERLGDVDVVALRLQALHGSLGEAQRLVREPGGEERLGAVGEHGRAADAERRVDAARPRRSGGTTPRGRRAGRPATPGCGACRRPAWSSPATRTDRGRAACPPRQRRSRRPIRAARHDSSRSRRRGWRRSCLRRRRVRRRTRAAPRGAGRPAAAGRPAGSSRPPCRRRRGERRPASPAPTTARTPRSRRGWRRATSTPGLPARDRRARSPRRRAAVRWRTDSSTRTQLPTGIAHDPQQLDPLGTRRRRAAAIAASSKALRRIGECPRQQVGDGRLPGAERTASDGSAVSSARCRCRP